AAAVGPFGSRGGGLCARESPGQLVGIELVGVEAVGRHPAPQLFPACLQGLDGHQSGDGRIPAACPRSTITAASFRDASSIISSPIITAPLASTSVACR